MLKRNLKCATNIPRLSPFHTNVQSRVINTTLRHTQRNYRQYSGAAYQEFKWENSLIFSCIVGSALGLSVFAMTNNKPNTLCDETSPDTSKKQYPLMTAKEMRDLVEKEDRLIVAYNRGVYDVTEFTGHPGGYGRIQMAAGGDLEVFWSVYTQHNRGHIEILLERYKIAELSEEEAKIIRDSTHFDNPYVNDPPPSPYLLTNTRYPYNAEGKLSDLREHWITPIGKHFVRNHSTVPDIKAEDYKLLVTGAGLQDTVFTLDDIKNKFPKVHVSITNIEYYCFNTSQYSISYNLFTFNSIMICLLSFRLLRCFNAMEIDVKIIIL
jgi:cytochrome b involved in lipid metabolism